MTSITPPSDQVGARVSAGVDLRSLRPRISSRKFSRGRHGSESGDVGPVGQRGLGRLAAGRPALSRLSG